MRIFRADRWTWDVKLQRGGRKWRFSIDMSSYLEYGAFSRGSYYRMLTGNRMQAIEWCHVQ